ncbi:MAG: nucleotidyl transferase AbiEii/AbiGii toxin family protein [Saprospiraceae bacterium]|nr:nucleotidyl transferase AbiEii/AbiGii toxin family protein [Saprospiraceae bacterium]
MQEPTFQQFRLVGGTALALQIGHRISIDLDLFTSEDFDNNAIISAMQPMGRLEILVDKPPFLQVRLDDVKVDFLKYPYPFVSEGIEVEDIRLATIENIAVMKLLAIARRGVKKDFYDFYFLLEQFKMAEIVGFFEEKVPNVDLFHIFKSLIYFGDADVEGDPKMLKKVSWSTVKKTISKKVETYLNQER